MNQIALNIDCMEYMKKVPDKYFDLAIVDPPYGNAGGGKHAVFGIRKSSRNYKEKLESFRGKVRQVQNPFLGEPSLNEGGVQRTGGTWASVYGKKIIAWDVAPNEQYFKELFRISRNQIIWGGNYFNLPPTRCFIVWKKTNIPENFSMAMCEYAWTSFNDNAKVVERSSTNIDGRFHPTQKPVDLYEWILNRYAKEGDKIFDSHMGSGSSRIACHRLGFEYVGCEIDKEYFEKQEERFRKESERMRLF